MPILDRSKIRPEILEFLDGFEKIQLKGVLEFLKLKENKGFNIQPYLKKIEDGNKRFFENLSKKEGSIDDFYGFFTDEEVLLLVKFFRFIIEYYMDIESAKFPIPQDVKIEEVNAGGVRAEWQIVPEAAGDKVILYFHGGGFVLMSPKTHRLLTIELAKITKMRVLSVDYRLAPEHPHPAALEDCVNAYKWLLSQGFKSENIIIAGDSAGGNLTLTTLIKLRDDKISLPVGAIALSPATDYTDSSETFYKNAKTDPILADRGVFWWTTSFLAGADPNDPHISPLKADLKGLPPILIQVSTSEMLYDHSTRFIERAKAAGVNTTLQEWNDTIHVFQGFGLKVLPEAKEAIEEIGKFIQNLFKK
ncbi:MAG: alpha/beta hydrolase [Promethearchaeota archaeon]